MTRLMYFFLVLAILGGCVPSPQNVARYYDRPSLDNVNTARIDAFLSLKDSQGPPTRLEVAQLEILAGDTWLPLGSKPLNLDSAAIGSGQFYLGGSAVPPGVYREIRLLVDRGEIQASNGAIVESATDPAHYELNLPSELVLQPGDSESLFFTWDIHPSDIPGKPVLAVSTPERQLLINHVFVTCPDIDTVFVLRADNNRVVDSFGLTGAPTYLSLDTDSSRQRAFFLTPGDRKIKIVDLLSYRVVDFFPTPLNDVPSFMTVSPDGRSAYLIDERNGYLSRMDLATGQLLARAFLGFSPQYALFLPDQNLLAVSLSLSQEVVLLDPLNLSKVGSISTGSAPQGLLAWEDQLYIAEYGDNMVSVVDLRRTSSHSRILAGFGPHRFLKTDSQIYVSNYLDGSLSVLFPGQLGAVQVIPGIGRPMEMAWDQSYRRLYVADEKAGALSVVDTNANLLLEHIELGGSPFGLAVIQ